ncbi:MAG: tRNA 2-thiouridine(34) synthase MnmA [Muribaculaceae bacterium]|nr:tRNA 2-thiouridine(34) synthase MnmA [Muribaculaceae bacterium]
MRIAALISGGVDSAVAVHKLVEEGHDVHLFYIRIGMEGDGGDCSAEEDLEMCNLIAHRYGLPLEEIDLHRQYWDNVMAYTLQEVRKGLTPNPDVMCNRMVKFGFFEQMRGHEFDLTATGHYATTVETNGIKWLATGLDPVKDQTDFLSRITYDQLKHVIFPIGHMPKAEVREIAMQQKLPNAMRHDSQGICFLGKINYNDFLEQHLGTVPGDIVEIETGKILGQHRGYWFHTIGQRKGLRLGGGPWFVIDKDVNQNILYVSRGYDTPLQYSRRITLSSMHLISGSPWGESLPDEGIEITFKNRHMPSFLRGTLRQAATNPEHYIIDSREQIQGVAPGQFVTLYDKDSHLCYGSGIIWKGTEE